MRKRPSNIWSLLFIASGSSLSSFHSFTLLYLQSFGRFSTFSLGFPSSRSPLVLYATPDLPP